MLYSEDIEKLALFTVVLFLFSSIIFFGQPATSASIVVPCKFMDNDVLFGGRVLAVCHYEYTPTGPGTESFILNLPGSRDIVKAYIDLYDVSLPTKTIDISGSLPPESKTTHLVVIPEEAYNIAIYGEIIGKGVGTDYPDQPYIKGGTKDLVCGLDCKYVKDIIIDSPGSFTLEVFSGYNGAGIDYRIFGSYNLPYPSVTVKLNDKIIGSFDKLRNDVSLNLMDQLDRKENVIYLTVDGQPNFKVQIHVEQYCQLTGTDWSCVFVKSEYTSGTLALCTRKVIATCDFNNINLHIPLVDLKYKESASGPIKISIAGQEWEVDPSSTEFILNKLPEGEYVLTATYNIPYIVPEAVAAAGVCAIDRNKITFAGAPGREGTSTFTIYNIGKEDILVRIRVPDELAQYISIEPSEVVIPAGSSHTFTVHAHLPDYVTVLRSDIQIEGCAADLVGLTIELNTTTTLPIPLPELFIPAVGSIATFIVLLFARRYVERVINPRIYKVLLIVLPTLAFFIIRLMFI